MEPTAILNFDLWNTVPWKRNFQILRNGIAVPILGATLRMQFRTSPAEDDVAMDLSTANNLLAIRDGANGVWGFNVTAADALQCPPGTYFHDMLVFPVIGDPFPAFSGKTVVTQGITRSTLQWQTT